MNGIDEKFDLTRLLEWQAEIENDFERDRHHYYCWKRIVQLMIEIESYDSDDESDSDSQLELDLDQ